MRYIVVLHDEGGDWPPMYWRGAWDANRDNANHYRQDIAETVAFELEDGFPGRCVRVIQV